MKNNAKISKLMIWPSRKVNLGNYETVDLNAGVEITFEKPVEFDSKEIVKALNQARKTIGEEMLEQNKAFRPKREGGEQ
jgi:hypothetical protein